LSDGTALTFQLNGKPLPPKPEEPITLSLKAKSKVLQSISINNWLPVNQKFAVSFNLAGDKPPVAEGILINSVNVLEVAMGNSQHFKLSILALKKGSFVLNIFFQNKENREYLHHILNLQVEEPTVMKTFELANFVREKKVLAIPIENPLPTAVTILPEHFQIDSKDIFLAQKTPLTIKPQSEVCFDVIFRPLLTYKNQKSLIKISSPDLGNFVYETVLTSEKSSNIPTINFKASLGTDHTRHYQLVNYLTKAAPYTCKIERLSENDMINPGPTDYVAETPTVQAAATTSMAGTETSVNIKFEPSMIGVSKALLTISNSEGGEFQAYLVGLSSPPLPKGPFKISSKGGSLDFKNTLYESKEFFIRIDNPNFVCNTKSPFKLDPKKSVSLSLTFKGTADNNTGRITIETKEQIAWIYYLQGV
jgi:hydrocephalus-inducing protein